MNRQELVNLIRVRRSFLCVGLDPDPDRMPPHLRQADDPMLTFNKRIIDATRDLCVAYKPNTAFYEALGVPGWELLEQTISYIGDAHFIIADAKRGDIGNTSKRYAKAFFEQLGADALTVAPYMGEDSITPFLGFEGKWAILLALTSNSGSADFQTLGLADQSHALFEEVLSQAGHWGSPDELMFVVGATHPEKLADIRRLVPEHFLLVPGIGAQGGSLELVCQFGLNQEVGILVNASRSILYAGSGADFTTLARAEAQRLQQEMEGILMGSSMFQDQ